MQFTSGAQILVQVLGVSENTLADDKHVIF